MSNEYEMCGVLELGIGGDSCTLITNLCEDVGIDAVHKDIMSIIIDVYDEPVNDDTSNVDIKIYTEEIELEVLKKDGDSVLVGKFRVGEATSAFNDITSRFSGYHEGDDEEGDGDEWDEEWDEDDELTFIIAVGDFDKATVGKLEGQINTTISRIPLVFDEGDIVNMTLENLGKYYLD